MCLNANSPGQAMGKNKPRSRFWSCYKIFTSKVFNCTFLQNQAFWTFIFIFYYFIPLDKTNNFFKYWCSGLQKYLNEQGFNIVGYGCTTCIGNSGDLDESVASAITDNGKVSLCLYETARIKLSISRHCLIVPCSLLLFMLDCAHKFKLLTVCFSLLHDWWFNWPKVILN